MEITLKQYDTIEDLVCPFFQIKRREIAFGTLPGCDTDGNRTEFPIRQIVDVIKKTGIWGYTDDIGCIHYWHDNASFHSILEFFAHEIAHHTGTPDEDTIAEEMRADEYAKVAVTAYAFAVSLHENRV